MFVRADTVVSIEGVCKYSRSDSKELRVLWPGVPMQLPNNSQSVICSLPQHPCFKYLPWLSPCFEHSSYPLRQVSYVRAESIISFVRVSRSYLELCTRSFRQNLVRHQKYRCAKRVASPASNWPRSLHSNAAQMLRKAQPFFVAFSNDSKTNRLRTSQCSRMPPPSFLISLNHRSKVDSITVMCSLRESGKGSMFCW